MELLEQCQKWFEQDEIQKIIDALEAVPLEEHTPEIDSELAKAYIAIADLDEQELFEKALELLMPHEEYFKDDHCWNYRIASAYYYLNQEGKALDYFKKALEAREGDEDTLEYIADCQNRLALPRFAKNFRQRTKESWAAFAAIEAELRSIMDDEDRQKRGEELLDKCSSALKVALSDTAFELGFNGEKYELILSPEGLRSRLFPLVYFQSQAPQAVLENWNIWVGRQRSEGFELRVDDIGVKAEDVLVWAEKNQDEKADLILYCAKLVPLLKQEPDKAWWMLSTLVDQVLGEINTIALIGGFDVFAEAKAEPSVLLADLPQALQEMGFTFFKDGEEYLENSYLAYEMEPISDPDADWRLDIFAGNTRLPVIINEYLAARSDLLDEYHQDGIVAGFFCYPLEGFSGEERSNAILDFRDSLQEAIFNKVGEEAVTFLGGATGLYYGYLDFIAWDLFAVLDAAQEFFQASTLPRADFHVFRRDVGGVPLLDEEATEPDIHEETGSLLSAEDIATLESFNGEIGGYFGKMINWLNDFIENGVNEGRFTEKQAHQDLQIALWYAYACINMNDYIYYYRAAEWLKDSESRAKGCGTWYYRYSAALTYCGRLEEAWRYAEQGTAEEPDYPWIWLQVGKLRAHFGDKTGALEAVQQGLQLVPNDYEFLTLQEEINAGATLEQMEYHWIDPGADETLQMGMDEDADEKRLTINCINIDEKGLAEFYQLFAPKEDDYSKNNPCCEFHYPIKDHSVEISFRMNEAGLSKMGTQWLRQLKDWLDSGQWLYYTTDDGEGTLTAVLVAQNYQIGLIYKLPGEEQYFQIFRGKDGEEINAAWHANYPRSKGATDLRGTFAGFALLAKPQWDKTKLIRDLWEKWAIIVEETEESDDDSLIFNLGESLVAVSMMPYPIPDGEAEENAGFNYFWPEAVSAAKAHQAHLMVAVVGEENNLLELGKIYAKVLAACCRQLYTSGIYASGVVFEPQFYEECADIMLQDGLPIFNWVWFGLYQDQKGLSGYTYGLEQFGREEIEVLNTTAEPEELRIFMANIVSYVLEYDVELHDGETIGFSAADKHTIILSEGVALPGDTLKISYESTAEKINDLPQS